MGSDHFVGLSIMAGTLFCGILMFSFASLYVRVSPDSSSVSSVGSSKSGATTSAINSSRLELVSVEAVEGLRAVDSIHIRSSTSESSNIIVFSHQTTRESMKRKKRETQADLLSKGLELTGNDGSIIHPAAGVVGADDFVRTHSEFIKLGKRWHEVKGSMDGGSVQCSGCADTLLAIQFNSNGVSYYKMGVNESEGYKVFDSSCKPSKSKLTTCDDYHKIDTNFNIMCSTSKSSLITDLKLEHPDFCAIDEVVINDCDSSVESFENINFIITGRGMSLVSSLHTIVSHDSEDITNYIVKSGCESCMTSMPCDGDEYYRRAIRPSGPSKSSNCYIQYDKQKMKLKVTTSQSPIPIQVACVGNARFRIFRRNKKPNTHSVRDHVTAMCNGGRLRVSSPDTEITSVRFCEKLKCFEETLNDRRYEVELPDRMVTHNADLKIITRTRTGKVIQRLKCNAINLCSRIDCILCLKALYNPSCYKFVHYIAIGGLIGLLAFAIILTSLVLKGSIIALSTACKIVITGFKISLAVYKILIKPFKIMSRNSVRIIRQEMLRRSSGCSQEVLETVVVDKSNIVSRAERKALATKMAYANTIILIVSVILITHTDEVHSCSDHSIISGTDIICKGGRDQRCLLTKKSIIGLYTHSQDSCLTVKSKSGKVAMSISIEVDDLIERCVQDEFYFTTDYQTNLISEVHCPSVGFCTDGFCDKFTLNSSLPFQSDADNHVGSSGCEYSCGSFSCGCFLSGDSCLVYRHYLTSKDYNAIKISKCKEWSKKYHLKVKIMRAGEGDVDKTVIVAVGELYKVMPQISIRVTSTTDKESLEGDELSYVREDWLSFMCSEVNSKSDVSLLKLGSLQCPSEESAKNCRRTCSTPPTLFTHSLGENVIYDSSHNFDYNSFKKKHCNLMPYKVTSHTYDEDEIGLHRHLNIESFHEIEVSFDDFEVSNLIDDVSCEVQFKKLTGCFSCSVGARLLFNAVSTSANTLMLIDCGSGSSSAVNIGEDPSDYEVTISFTKAVVTENCTVHCGEFMTSMEVKGDLNYIGEFSNVDNGKTRRFSELFSDHASVSLNIFSSLFSAWHSFVGYVLLIVLMPVALIVASNVVNLFKLMIEVIRVKKMK